MIIYLRRVIGLKKVSIIIIVDLESWSSSSSWGWRQSFQQTRVQQWDIYPSLLQGRPFRSTISSSSLFIHIWLFGIHQKIICRDTCAVGDLAGKPQSIHWVSGSRFIFWILASSSTPTDAVALATTAQKPEINNNNHRWSFWFNDPSYIALACTFRVCMSLLGFALYFLHACNSNCSLT